MTHDELIEEADRVAQLTKSQGQAIDLLLTELYFATHPRPRSEMPTLAEAKRRLLCLGTPHRNPTPHSQ